MCNFLPFFKKAKYRKDESKDHGTADESSAKQQICGDASITFVRRKNTVVLVGLWLEGRQAGGRAGRWTGRQADEKQVDLKNLSTN